MQQIAQVLYTDLLHRPERVLERCRLITLQANNVALTGLFLKLYSSRLRFRVIFKSL